MDYAYFQRLQRVTAASVAGLLAGACSSASPEGDTASMPTSVSSPSGVSTEFAGETTGLSDGESVPTTDNSMGTNGETATTTGPSTDPTDATTTNDDTATTGSDCTPGAIVCEDNIAKECDGDGGFVNETPCPDACAPGLGCVACVPDSLQCAGQTSQVCTPDGSGYVDLQDCDPVLGLACNPDTGGCTGACAELDTLSYIGCEYYPVVTPQLDNFIDDNPYAVAVANASDQVATVVITRGNSEILTTDVAANSVEVVTLPWVDDLVLGNGPSKIAEAAAYRLRSNQPVTVYQYNPLNSDITNDASLMLPVNTWTGEYIVASWQFWAQLGNPGFYSVTASQDDTTVMVTAPGNGTPTQAGAGIDATGDGIVTLNAGDVLNVYVSAGGDATGTQISADKPVQVMGGHKCTQVPIGTNACDHLEESMFPVETLAKEYIVVPPVQVPNDAQEKAIVVRIIAAEADTTLTFTPNQNVATNLAQPGDFVEIPASVAKFVVTADKRILVAKYMVGQGGGFGTSDPAMVLAVPTAQFRTDYLFYAQTGWLANYVDIIAPQNAAVQVDGANVNNFTPIANTNFALAHVKLSNAGDGTHSVTSAEKVGISVYGVQNFGSYWYPGGLDLQIIPQ